MSKQKVEEKTGEKMSFGEPWVETSSAQLVPIAKTENTPVPAAGAEQIKQAILTLGQQWLVAREADKRKAAEEALAARPEVKNSLAVRDFFRNGPAGAQLFVMNAVDGIAGIRTVVDNLESQYKLFEFALLQPLDPEGLSASDPQPVDDLSALISSKAETGVMIHVLAQIRPGTCAELMTRRLGNALIGSAPGRDAIMVFPQEVCETDKDPACVTAHSLIGAALGKRLSLDMVDGMAEPMAGDRANADGPKGSLKCGVLMKSQLYTETERYKKLATKGINAAYDWYGVGRVVIDCNRSLLDGNTVYIFGSATRLRQQVQAIFHETTRRNVMHGVKRDGLIRTKGRMDAYLKNLKDEDLVKTGEVNVDHDNLVLKMAVIFEPVRPTDNVLIEYVIPPLEEQA